MPTPTKDFDSYNTQQLRQLETALAIAQQRQKAAHAVTDALSARYTTAQACVSTAQGNAAAAAANLAAAQTTTQTIAHGVPFAAEAQEQSVQIVAKLTPVLEQAHATSLLLVDALVAIDALVNQVERRKGKNELISGLVVSGASQSKTDALAALAIVTTSLQNAMLALASAEAAKLASDKVVDASQRLRVLVAPATSTDFDPMNITDGRLWSPGDDPLESIRDLAGIVAKKDISVLAVLDALSNIARNMAREQQNAATQTALELNAANDRLNRTTAAAQSASAALAAAEAAVA